MAWCWETLCAGGDAVLVEGDSTERVLPEGYTTGVVELLRWLLARAPSTPWTRLDVIVSVVDGGALRGVRDFPCPERKAPQLTYARPDRLPRTSAGTSIVRPLL